MKTSIPTKGLVCLMACLMAFTSFGQSWKSLGNLNEFGQPSYGTAFDISTASDASGNVYVAYTDVFNDNRLTVKKWDGSRWTIVGGTSISVSVPLYPVITTDSQGNLYAAYGENSVGGLLTVKKWNGTTWSLLGSVGISTGPALYTAIAADAGNGKVYVAYTDDTEMKVKVQQWNGVAWSAVGSTDVSSEPAMSIATTLDGSGNLYIAYPDDVYNTSKLTVKKWNGTVWSVVGSTGISGGYASYNNIVADGSGNLYVGYQDGSKTSKLTVQKWNGSAWSVVGTAGMSAGAAVAISMRLANSGNLYVCYRDESNNGKVTVQKWNGSVWSAVGGAVSTGLGDQCSMQVDASENIYTAYMDAANANKLAVKKWDGTTWATLGISGLSTGQAAYTCMVKDGSGNLYVAYQDEFNGYKLTVQKWDGTVWSLVGSAGFSPGKVSAIAMVAEGNGSLYVAYTDELNANKLTVQKWNGNTWALIGAVGISAGSVGFNTIAKDAGGNIYVAYTDSLNNSKLTVQKWNGSAWSVVGSTGFTTGTSSYNSIAIDASNNVYVATADGNVNDKLTVLKWNGTNWLPVGNAGISLNRVGYNSMITDASGNLYVAYSDGGKSNKLSVQKWDGTSWAILGTAGITTRAATYNSINIDSGGNLYVACSDGQAYSKLLTVYKWDGTSWSVVGNGSVARGGINYNALVVGNNGILYVAYTSPKLFVQVYNKSSFYSSASGIEASTLSNWNTSTSGLGSPPAAFNTADTFIVQTNHVLTNTGSINLGSSKMVVSPGAALIANSSNLTGDVTLQQNVIGQRGWRIFANPFSTDQTISTLAATNGITIHTTPQASGLTDTRTFSNATNTWSNVTGTLLAANTPYALFVRGLASEVTGTSYTGGPTAFTYSTTGTLNGSSVTITPASTSNFMLVGNPYAAPVKTSALTNSEGVGYYVYTINRGATQTLQRTKAGSWVAVMSSSATTTIPVLGAIAYKPASASSYNITAATDISTSGSVQTGLFRTQQTIPHLELQVEQDSMYQDKLFVRLDNQATAAGIDRNDLEKFWNDNVNLYTKSADNKYLAVDARANIDSIPVGIAALAGNYSFKVATQSLPAGTTIYLIDHWLHTQTELKQGGSYPFSITSNPLSKGEQRFVLTFSKQPVATAAMFTMKVLGNKANTAIINISGNQNPVTITVIDMLGRTAATTTNLSSGTHTIQLGNLTAGIYLLHAADGKTTIVEKIVVP